MIMWPFKPKSNPAIIEIERVKQVKIPVTNDEARAIEEVILSSDASNPLQFRYCEHDHCIYLYRK